MDYKINGRIFEGDEVVIKEIMKELELDRKEAIRAYFEDLGIIKLGDRKTPITPIESEGNSKRNYNKSDKPRKKTERVRKVAEDKKIFIDKVAEMLNEMGATDSSVKNELEVNFNSDGANYTFRLTKHKNKKAE